jgi:nitrate reductase alpha subunit
MILRFAAVTDGELAYRSYKNMEEKVGLTLVPIKNLYLIESLYHPA